MLNSSMSWTNFLNVAWLIFAASCASETTTTLCEDNVLVAETVTCDGSWDGCTTTRETTPCVVCYERMDAALCVVSEEPDPGCTDSGPDQWFCSDNELHSCVEGFLVDRTVMYWPVPESVSCGSFVSTGCTDACNALDACSTASSIEAPVDYSACLVGCKLEDDFELQETFDCFAWATSCEDLATCGRAAHW